MTELPITEPDLPIVPAPEIAHIENQRFSPAGREIYLDEEIGEDDGVWFIRRLRWLENRDSSPVRVILATPGGDEAASFQIHDAIRATPCPVEVLAVGDVCSAGVLLLACGDRRLVMESVSVMSHEGTLSDGELGFRASRDRAQFRAWQSQRWCELMARYTPEDAKFWQKTTEKKAEYWLLGGHAIVEAGLADAVIHSWPPGGVVSNLGGKQNRDS